MARTIPTESAEQKALMSWWSWHYPDKPLSLFHIPNGGKRDLKTAARLKAEGVKPGVADLFLMLARGGYHGLFIEMKPVKGGRQTEAQKEFERVCSEAGYRYVLAKGWGEAVCYILEYLNGAKNVTD